MPKKMTIEQKTEILGFLKQDYSVTAVMRLCNVGCNSVCRVAEKNGINLKRDTARTKYSKNIIDEVLRRLENGESRGQIAKDMHINETSISNFLEKKIKKITVKENLEYLKKYFEGWDAVSLVKFQNLARRKLRMFEETLIRIGNKLFKTETVVNYINELTPDYYCDFWR